MAMGAPGDSIGRYLLQRPLGSGSFGTVWSAQLVGPAGFRKPVALKIIRASGDSADPSWEARLGALLHHPNLVAVYGLEHHDGDWLVVMEHVDGVTVSQLLRRGPLPPGAVLDIGIQACAALAHIHSLRLEDQPGPLVHRDIKPSNLLVDRSGLVKVADLGIAAVAGTGPVMGTPAYMAPEQAWGRAEPRSDLFGLAATLAHCALGQLPFGNHRDAQERIATLADDPVSEQTIADLDAVLPGLGWVLAAALQADPDARPATARELATSLSALRTDAPDGPAIHTLIPPHETPKPAPERDLVDGDTLLQQRGNLPPERDAFVGRSDELRALLADVRGGTARVITVLGPGGIGKTRLATSAARRLCDQTSPEGWFFDLSEARSVEGICVAVARALGLRLGASEPVDLIGTALAERRGAVLVFDNLEQCVEHVPATLGRWLERVPECRVLATSRVPLGLAGEHPVRLGPLTTQQAADLFVARAPVPVEPADLPSVHRIVARVEGVPLAVELAAARTRSMAVEDIEMQLGLRLLGTVMWASLQWSWDLLQPTAREALAQLSVFEGPFPLRAAQGVLRVEHTGWAIDLLQELVQASLVRIDTDTQRFSLPVVVREFASAQLDDPAVERRHGVWHAQLKDDATDADLDDLVAACRRAVAQHDRVVASACALGAWNVLRLRGPFSIGLELLDAAAELGDPEPALDRSRISAHRWLGTVDIARDLAEEASARSKAQGEPLWQAVFDGLVSVGFYELGRRNEAWVCLQGALELARGTGDRRELGVLLGTLARMDQDEGRARPALRNYAEALALLRSVGDLDSEADLLRSLADLQSALGQRDEAIVTFQRALELHRTLGDRIGEGRVLGDLAGQLFSRGEYEQARDMLAAAAAIAAAAGGRRSQAVALGNLGTLLSAQGELMEALAVFREALRINRETGGLGPEASVQLGIGMVCLVLGELDQAAEACGESLRLFSSLGRARSWCHALVHLARVERARGDETRCLELLTEAAEIADRSSLPWETALVLTNLAEGPTAEASDEALRHVEATGDRDLTGRMLLARSRTLLDQGRLDEAHAAVERAAPMLEISRLDGPIRLALGRAAIAGARGDQQRRMALLDDARDALDALGSGPGAPLRQELDGLYS